MNNLKYQICKKCVMDTTDPSITFSDDGICDNCNQFENITKKYWFDKQNDKVGFNNIIKKVNQVKKENMTVFLV